MSCNMSLKYTFFMLTLMNSKITWETTQKKKVKIFTRISGLWRNTIN